MVRLFVVHPETGDWNEVTSGTAPVVRMSASDLLRAKRERASIRADNPDVAVILDLEVAVSLEIGTDFRRATEALGTDDGIVRYAGTVDGLTGLVADIERADVADGVTIIPVWPSQDSDALGAEVLHRLALRRLSA